MNFSVANGTTVLKVSVILVNYNTASLARDCLNSIKNLNINDLEVVLLDNGSQEFDPEPFRAAWPGIIIRTIKDNVGHGSGANEAAKAARGEYLLLLNTDTVFPEYNEMNRLVRFLDDHPAYAIASPLVVDQHGAVDPWQAGHLPAVWRMVASVPARLVAERVPLLRPLLARIAINLLPPVDRDIEVSTLAASFIRRSCFDAVEGFDPEYFLYLDDTDLCKKLQVRGWRIRWIVSARVVHFEAGSSSDPQTRERRYARSQRIYFRKWKGRLGVLQLMLVQLPFRLAPALERWRRNGPVQNAPGSWPHEDAQSRIDSPQTAA